MSLANRSLQRRVDELEQRLRERGSPSEREYHAALARLTARAKLLARLEAVLAAIEAGQEVPARSSQDAKDAATLERWNVEKYGEAGLDLMRAEACETLRARLDELHRRANEPRVPNEVLQAPPARADDEPRPARPPQTVETSVVRPELPAEVPTPVDEPAETPVNELPARLRYPRRLFGAPAAGDRPGADELPPPRRGW